MPTTGAEQKQILQEIIEATPEKRQEWLSNAYNKLKVYATIASAQRLTKIESKNCDIIIEYIVQIECFEKREGPWFRIKRRFQLVREYFKP